jgi:hypothetical protein
LDVISRSAHHFRFKYIGKSGIPLGFLERTEIEGGEKKEMCQQLQLNKTVRIFLNSLNKTFEVIVLDDPIPLIIVNIIIII